MNAVYKQAYIYICIYMYVYMYVSISVCVYIYIHMQGAGLNVILKVYMLHNMHPGNMWNVG